MIRTISATMTTALLTIRRDNWGPTKNVATARPSSTGTRMAMTTRPARSSRFSARKKKNAGIGTRNRWQ